MNSLIYLSMGDDSNWTTMLSLRDSSESLFLISIFNFFIKLKPLSHSVDEDGIVHILSFQFIFSFDPTPAIHIWNNKLAIIKRQQNYNDDYTPAPRRGRGVYCFTSVRPSKIFFVAFFSVIVDGRNLIFGHKHHIGMPYCGNGRTEVTQYTPLPLRGAGV
jgi:hypothetical protein